MKQPVMPTRAASLAPDEWDRYWSEVKRYEKYLENRKYADYRKDYYKKKIEQRQIEKMKTFMLKYPDEARQFVAEHLQSK